MFRKLSKLSLLTLTLAMIFVNLRVPVAHAAAAQVTFWGDWTGDGATQIQTMVDAFNKSQSDIQVNYVPTQDIVTKFLTAATSGSAPDLLIWDRFRTALYAPKGVLMPIDDLMAASKISSADFYSEALRELTYGGKLYGLPMTVDTRALYYNKTMLDAAGIKPPTTWDELEQAAIKLTVRKDGKLQVAGVSLQDVGLFNMWLQQAGGKMVTDDGSKTAFNSPEGLSVLAYWDKLINQDKVYEIGFEQGLGQDQDAFVTGKVAMQFNGPWMLSTYKKYGKDLTFGVVPSPAGPKGNKGGVMGGFGLAIPTATTHSKEAWAFMTWWLAQPANSVLWAKTSLSIPGNLKAIADPFFQSDPYLKPFTDALKDAKIRPPFAGYPSMEGDALIPNLQLFVQGKQSAADTLKKAQQDGDQILTDNNIPQ